MLSLSFPRAPVPQQHLVRRAGIRQRQIQRATRAAAHQPAAGRCRHTRDRPIPACKCDVQFRRMARRRVLFTVKRRIERAVGDQGEAVVGFAPIQPRLHRLGDVDQDVLVLVRRGDADVRGNCRSKRWRIAGIDRAL